VDLEYVCLKFSLIVRKPSFESALNTDMLEIYVFKSLGVYIRQWRIQYSELNNNRHLHKLM